MKQQRGGKHSREGVSAGNAAARDYKEMPMLPPRPCLTENCSKKGGTASERGILAEAIPPKAASPGTVYVLGTAQAAIK